MPYLKAITLSIGLAIALTGVSSEAETPHDQRLQYIHNFASQLGQLETLGHACSLDELADRLDSQSYDVAQYLQAIMKRQHAGIDVMQEMNTYKARSAAGMQRELDGKGPCPLHMRIDLRNKLKAQLKLGDDLTDRLESKLAHME